jgi:predicted nucleic acid-binding Zn finger protein
MSNEHTDDNESTDIDQRTRRALERVLTVTHTDGTPIREGEEPTVVSVHSGNSGKERRVDVREGRCTCPDHKHRGVECYHIRRARMALGAEPVDTTTLAACDVHSRFAEHAPGPVVATSDGGLVGAESAEFNRLDPRVREHVEEHGSSAHGYDHAPEP